MDYENFLKTLSIKELKTLIKKYTSHVKILVTRKTKSQLIEHLLMHTELKNNKVVTKKIDIGDLPEKTKKEEKKKDEKKKLSKDESELLRQEYGDFIPSKEIIEKDIKENKERVKSNAETEKKKIYSIIKDFSDKEEWKKTTKQEKQLVCSSIYSFIHNYKDKEILKNLPSHLYDYFYKYCEEAKNDKTINKLKEMTNKEETKKEEIKKIEKRKIPLLEFLKPYQDYEDTGDKQLNEIYLKVGEEIDKYFNDSSILDNKISEIKNLQDTLEKVRNWAEKKTASGKNEVEYITFVKSVVYNMFFKNELDRLTNNNKFESIAIAHIIASDPLFQQYYTNRTYKTTVETFFKLKPLIPLKDYPKNIIQLYKKLYTDYEKGNLPKNTEELQKYYPEKVKEIMTKK